MKKVTKALAVLLALVMVVGLCACGNKDNGDSTTSPSPAENSATPSVSPSDDTGTSDDGTSVPDNTGSEIQTVVPGKLTMATNAEFPPYEYHEGGEIKGIDAEIAQLIADKLGLELVINDMDFTAILAAIEAGKADISLAGLTVDETRLQSVDFSQSYATGVQVVIVKEDSAITSIDDLFAEGANHTIGVQENTTGDIFTTGDIEKEGLGTVMRYNKGADAVQALITGKIDCVVIDNEPAKSFVEANEGLKILDTEYAEEQYAVAITKGNTSLGEAIDKALDELKADGTIQSILDKYIGN